MGLADLPANHWARGRIAGNYVIAGTLLSFAAGTYYYTTYRVRSHDNDVDAAIDKREAKAKAKAKAK